MPKIVNHDECQQDMLEKRLRLFTRKGYCNINMKEIAAKKRTSILKNRHCFDYESFE